MTKQVLGVTVKGSLSADQLATVPADPLLELVAIEGAELTALCPVTDQPDLYRFRIEYVPTGELVESKALKLYLMSWRMVGIFAEDLAAALAEDLGAVLATAVRVTLQQQVRGGLSITATAVSGRS